MFIVDIYQCLPSRPKLHCIATGLRLPFSTLLNHSAESALRDVRGEETVLLIVG